MSVIVLIHRSNVYKALIFWHMQKDHISIFPDEAQLYEPHSLTVTELKTENIYFPDVLVVSACQTFNLQNPKWGLCGPQTQFYLQH